MASHITVSLNPNADESRLNELDSLDLDDTPKAKDTVDENTFAGMNEI